MNDELVFLLEEPSAKALLEELLPRILPDGFQWRLIPFQGKQDLEKNLVKRIRGYRIPGARFLVLRDQDAESDCTRVKANLLKLCAAANKTRVVVRIACREIESFYLADLAAVEQGLNITDLARNQEKAKFRQPDRLHSPSKELRDLTGGLYQKVGGSRAIAKYLDLQNTRSASFRALISGIRKLTET